jgi:hypothetical protein
MKFLSIAAVFLSLTLLAVEPPPGWKFQGAGTGGVTDDGNLYVEVNRQQEETDWLSPALPLVPGDIYRLDFDLLVTPENADGNVTPGLVNYSVDTKRSGDSWQHETLFLPSALEPDRMRIRLGAWKLGGRAEFKNWQLRHAIPFFRDCGDGLALGTGERIDGNTYTFTQSFQADGPATTRLLPRLDNIRYNTSRFCLERPDACVTYAITVPGRRQLAGATLELFVNYHSSGKVVVEASTDGQFWTTLDTLDDVGAINVTLPINFFPADTIYFRFHAEGPTYLQVNRVCYTTQVDGPPASAVLGKTHFAIAETEDDRLSVQFLPVTDLLPGNHTITLQVSNLSNQSLRLRPATVIDPQDARASGWQGDELALPARQSATIAIPVNLPDAGDWQIRLALGGDSAAAYTIDAKIHEIQRLDYGAVLREDDTAVLWSADAGWHVSRERLAPIARDSALRIQAAANEAEATQLVLRPDRDLAGVTLAASSLAGPADATLPADCVEILREYYHFVEEPTDGYGYQGFVPDALPPIDAPLDLPASQNQPFWIRVKVPADTPAGTYRGTITVQDASGWSATVPLEVEVFGFTLPDRMTLETAFGFNPAEPRLYHKPADDAQNRQIVDQYFQALADHHLSPYDPAPFDHWSYEIRNASQGIAWQGNGILDSENPADGEVALKLVDDQENGNCIHSTQRLPLPDGPMQFSLQYRTAEAGQACTLFVTFYDAEGNWIPNHNRDFRFTGDGTWQKASGKIDSYPANAKSFIINLNPVTWAEDGHTTGTAWFDNILFQNPSTHETILADSFEPAKLDDLKVVFDWTKWDAAVTRALSKYHFNTIDIPVDALHSALEIDGQKLARFGGFLEGTPEFTALHRDYLHQIQEHLREKGWLDMSYVYWYDEPEEDDYPYVMNGFRKLREGAPDLRRFLTEQVEPALIGGPNLWCPVTYSTVLATIAERQAVGEDFWWYVCTGPKMPYATLFMDHPATNLRVWLWQTWQNQIQGVLIWSTVYWNCSHLYKDKLQNPYLDTMSWAAGYNFVKPGQRAPWGNGDGRFFYPPLATVNRTDDLPNLQPPVDSIRAEMLRDGIEDYEYCVILRNLRDEKSAELTPAELSRINALLTVPPQISQDMTHFTHSPAPILKRRAEIGRAITELLKNP